MLVARRVEKLLAANKDIDTTRIANGCHRLHPGEWNVGEVAGTLAVYYLQYGVAPGQVRNDQTRPKDFQRVLVESLDVKLAWLDDEPEPSDGAF